LYILLRAINQPCTNRKLSNETVTAKQMTVPFSWN
jgi:hypothetical protein